jgi:hypothetical protein
MRMKKWAADRYFYLFAGLWLFVIFVSVLDGYLAVRYRHELHSTELNPLGRWLIRLNGNQVWLLVALKFAGTIVAATAVLLIHARWPRTGMTIMLALAVFQLWLLCFLLFT